MPAANSKQFLKTYDLRMIRNTLHVYISIEYIYKNFNYQLNL